MTEDDRLVGGWGSVGTASHADRVMPSVHERSQPARFGVALALLLAFTTVFGLWLFWGYQLLENLQHIERNVDDLQQTYLRGEQALVKVRTNVRTPP